MQTHELMGTKLIQAATLSFPVRTNSITMRCSFVRALRVQGRVACKQKHAYTARVPGFVCITPRRSLYP